MGYWGDGGMLRHTSAKLPKREPETADSGLVASNVMLLEMSSFLGRSASPG